MHRDSRKPDLVNFLSITQDACSPLGNQKHPWQKGCGQTLEKWKRSHQSEKVVIEIDLKPLTHTTHW